MRNIQDQGIPPHPLQMREVIADTGHGHTPVIPLHPHISLGLQSLMREEEIQWLRAPFSSNSKQLLCAGKQPSLGCLLMDWATAEELILCRLLEDIF